MPRAQLPEGSSAVDMDTLFPLESIRLGQILSSSPMLRMRQFILIAACSLVILAFLRSYIFREPSSMPPRKRNGGKGLGLIWEGEVTAQMSLKPWDRSRQSFVKPAGLRKLPGDGSSHCLLNRDRLTESFKRGPGSVHRPHGRRGKASPTSLSPQAPLAPLASMLSPDPKTSVESFESLSSPSSSQPPEPLRPLKHPSHKPLPYSSHPPTKGFLLRRPHMQAGEGRGPTFLSLDVPKLLDTQDTKIPDATLNTSHPTSTNNWDSPEDNLEARPLPGLGTHWYWKLMF
ncbi:uncharacterized protein C5orf60 [Aotus nancymaae]|uniref:uncharacterized protein C5orf60 n=1 Tax=Aotus nancymaae TaxID=37293 RepID=UPI0030FE6D00